eukprot:Gb_04519 [translate_table: standard]
MNLVTYEYAICLKEKVPGHMLEMQVQGQGGASEHQYAKCSSLRMLLTRPPHCKQIKLLPSAKASITICILPFSANMEAPLVSATIDAAL